LGTKQAWCSSRSARVLSQPPMLTQTDRQFEHPPHVFFVRPNDLVRLSANQGKA
jgi:hypothetical protein